MESTSVVGTTSIYWRREYFAMFIERRGALLKFGESHDWKEWMKEGDEKLIRHSPPLFLYALGAGSAPKIFPESDSVSHTDLQSDAFDEIIEDLGNAFPQAYPVAT